MPEINQEFIDKYFNGVTDTMCKKHKINPNDKEARAVLAYNILNPNAKIQANTPLIKLDTLFHILFFIYEDVHVSWGISHRILELQVKDYDSVGNITFNTNIGEEGLDIIDGSESLYSKKQLGKLKALFSNTNTKFNVEVQHAS